MHFNNQTENNDDNRTLNNEQTDTQKPELEQNENAHIEEPVSEEKEVTQEVNEPTEPPKKEVKKESSSIKEPTMTPEEIQAAEEFQKQIEQYEETLRDYQSGEIIEGIIVDFNEKEVMIDIGYKSEGSIPISEFPNPETIQLNATIKVFINKVENSEGKVSLSKRIADFRLAQAELQEIFKNNETVLGVIKQRVKGGMIVEIKGELNAFLPGSHISIKPIPNLDQFIGKELDFKIINIDEEKKNIIVSRKKVLEEEQQEKIASLLEKIEIDAELEGEVKNITEYGAFIDLGGMDGLLHITDMSWGHISHPSEMLNIGDKVKVKVINYEPEESKISLGLKQLVPHPWENIERKYEEGSQIEGKVVNITNYGAFVEIEPGVEGLVHVSEMSWTRKITHPKQILKVDDKISAIVLSVSKEERKISLGMKQMEANPWLLLDEKYPVGTIIKGKIKNMTPFGAFVEIENDIDGLIHISDISWTKRIYHPKEVFKKGQEVEVMILSIDKHLHRIALGVKQISGDPWEGLDHKLPINTEIIGVISKLISKGVLVELDVEGTPIEGFIPISHLAIPRLEKPELAFSVGDEVPMKVIELDMENRRLILSIKAYFFSREREELQKFTKTHEPRQEEPVEEIEEELEEEITQTETQPETTDTVETTPQTEEASEPETEEIEEQQTETVPETESEEIDVVEEEETVETEKETETEEIEE
ncbi:MAG: 30S ribosomal protein S1 [Candidatus Cloacimonas sp.]|nr:30S ribosomal protein S1 [Candidatus Cloacimonadota bacterium]